MPVWHHPLLLDLRDLLHHQSQRTLNVPQVRLFLRQKRLGSSVQDPERLQVRADVRQWLFVVLSDVVRSRNKLLILSSATSVVLI
jgi:hypothetical protein